MEKREERKNRIQFAFNFTRTKENLVKKITRIDISFFGKDYLLKPRDQMG